MRLSLCVATLGERGRLEPFGRALRALQASAAWELVLVVNGTGAAPATVAPWLDGVTLRLLHEPRPGKSRALNAAMAAAAGELLVFTDDDVVPDPDWLERLAAAAVRHPSARVFGGRILTTGTVPAWIRRSSNLQEILTSEHDLGLEERPYPAGKYPIGPNLAVRRSAIGAARWPEHLGPGTACPVGDESAFLLQLSAPAAADRIYVADARVRHAVAPAYFSLRAAVWRACLAGYTGGRFQQRARFADTPLATRAVHRLLRLRSLRELTCVAARAGGFLWGRYGAWRTESNRGTSL